MRSLALGTLLAAGLCGHAARAAQADPRSHEAAKVDSGVPFAEAVAGRGAPEAVAAPAGAPGSRPSAFAQLSGGAGRDGARPEIPPPAQDTP
ncbi:MAG: hypothetical protein HY554_04860, partial [Elusimicrobia bacterium]|nr:hypothetical protein [Elusimicrobiota bacterium]